MASLQEEQEQLREAWRDLGYAVFKAWGVLWLAKRFGFALKPWVAEREQRS